MTDALTFLKPRGDCEKANIAIKASGDTARFADRAAFAGYDFYQISAATHAGVTELVKAEAARYGLPV